MHSFSEKLPRVDKNVTLLSQALNCDCSSDCSDRRTRSVLTDLIVKCQPLMLSTDDERSKLKHFNREAEMLIQPS